MLLQKHQTRECIKTGQSCPESDTHDGLNGAVLFCEQFNNILCYKEVQFITFAPANAV